MERIENLEICFRGNKVGHLTQNCESRIGIFEYDREWLAKGFSISPLQLPLRTGAIAAEPTPFCGNFGIFEDSLPDGYGRYLLDKAMQREGIDISDIGFMERLALVGSGGMGALEYFPALTLKIEKESVTDMDILQEKALAVLRERQLEDAGLLLYNSGNSGGARPKAIFEDTEGHWLVKFRHIYDPEDIGKQEYEYNEYARGCGIVVPDFKLLNGRYFATRRFDIDASGKRIHTATAGGLLGLSLHQPYMDYGNLLSLTGYLTQSSEDVEQMFRRMVFNYLVENKDDHCKNFGFYVLGDGSKRYPWQWRLAPAYDQTLCREGYNGEHATSVNGKGSPSLEDFMAVGKKVYISEHQAKKIIWEMQSICKPILQYKL